MNPLIDKIVLTHAKDRCVVHLTNGVTLHFNFMKLGMTYIEGLAWIDEVLSGHPEQKSAA